MERCWRDRPGSRLRVVAWRSRGDLQDLIPTGSSLTMSESGAYAWIKVGVWALPIYGLLTLWGTLTHQPDPNADFGAYARYVSTTSYLVNHLIGSILGITLGIFGAIALGAYPANGRAGRTALAAMVLSVAGSCFILAIFGMSTFATPAVGRAYLAGQQSVVEVNQDILGVPLALTARVGGRPLRPNGAVYLHNRVDDRAGANPWSGAAHCG